MRIKLLDEGTILKIAAGEVVERPRSVVKELVENSIDAGAKNITVSITGGGIQEITVIDDGSGMEEEDVENAFLRHATSKIQDFEDLYSSYQMGFRGEALASILAVSDVELRTKTEQAKLGVKLEYVEGVKEPLAKVVMNSGTNLRVSNLFSRIPVRRKFLKSPVTEGNQITDLMYKLAVGHPEISVKYLKDGKEVFHTLAQDDARSNLKKLFGASMADALLPIQVEGPNYQIKGYVSNNQYYRGNRGLQYLYVNQRYVEHKGIQQVVEKCYRSLIPNGRYPVFQLFVFVSPDQIDVNVHPNKEQIKFHDEEELLSLLENGVQEVLFPPKLLPKEMESRYGDEGSPRFYPELSTEDKYTRLLEKVRSYPVEKKGAAVEIPDYKVEDVEEELLEFDEEDANPVQEGNLSPSKFVFNEEILMGAQEQFYVPTEAETEIGDAPIMGSEQEPSYPFQHLRYLGTLWKTYVLFEDGAEKELVILDQHAAHERILFERFTEQYHQRDIHRQPLLMPEVLSLLPQEVAAYEENKDLFDDLGFESESFGDKAITLRTVPMILEGVNGAQLFRALLDEVTTHESIDPMEERLIRLACKKAIKAGDLIHEQEAQNLLELLAKCDHPLSCPHGRPTLIRMGKAFLEREFMRVK